MQRWMTVWWCQSTKGSTPGTKPNHVFLVTTWQSTLTLVSVSSSVPRSRFIFVSCHCFMEGKKSPCYLICKIPSVIKHHIANEKYPTLKCLSYDIQSNFSKRVKEKTQIKLPADKGGGIITNFILLTLLTLPRSHTDFAQRFPHPHVEVSLISLLPFLHHNRLLSD